MKKIGIIGFGWLGKPLAHSLSTQGHEVRITRQQTTESEEQQYETFKYSLGQEVPNKLMDSLDYLIICCPLPATFDMVQASSVAESFFKLLPKHTRIIFTSSISVYAAHQPLHDEHSKDLVANNKNLFFENALTHYFSNRCIFLRLGGLIGEKRHPVVHLAKKAINQNGQQPINLVHQLDVIRAINTIIKVDLSGTFNLVYPFHPTKESYYQRVAQKFNLPEPKFEVNHIPGKRIDGSRITKLTDFNYSNHP